MEELIQFIVKNFFFVVVIAGFVISFLSKARKGETGRNRMPDFGGGPGLPKTPRRPESPRPPARSGGPAANAQTSEPAGSSVYRTREIKSAPAPGIDASPLLKAGSDEAAPYGSADPGTLRERPAAALHKAAIGRGDTAPSDRRSGGSFRMPEGSELQRAFVLAEVLGPPRAKRPFRKP